MVESSTQISQFLSYLISLQELDSELDREINNFKRIYIYRFHVWGHIFIWCAHIDLNPWWAYLLESFLSICGLISTSCLDLNSVGLSWAQLSSVEFSWADLSWFELTWADLSWFEGSPKLVKTRQKCIRTHQNSNKCAYCLNRHNRRLNEQKACCKCKEVEVGTEGFSGPIRLNEA